MFRSSVVKASLGLLVMAGVLAVADHGSGRVSWLSDAYAQPKPDIRNSKHNLSSASSNVVKSTSTSEICVYCHTPHGAGAEAPLWNRALPTGSYTVYSSETLDQTASSTVGAPSKLCLSCHDGTLAVGSVSNAPGSGTGNTSTSQIPTNLTDDKIALGSGGGSEGYTRLIGTNLTNDHPISVNFNNTIAGTDGELRSDAYNESTGAGATATDGKRIFNQRALGGARPHLVGFEAPNVQCPTCHDPHLASVTDSGALTGINNKFLRLNRFQLGTTSKSLSAYGDTTTDFPFDPAKDQVCTACHTRESKAWTESAHANSVVADEAYTSTAVTLREFPTSTKVWNAGCLNCHDTHTKTGARRLLREGVSGTNSAIENTCYQCHNTSGNSALGAASGNTALRTDSSTTTVQVPDIATEFGRTVKMPIANTTEVHEIRNADFEECAKTLGATVNNPPATSALGTKCNSLTGTNTNRHAECTDCHNPHRVRRGAKFYTTQVNGDTAVEKRRTHIPADDDPAINGTDGLLGNVVSGALRGAWGVEPNYGTIDVNTVWLPTAATPTFDVKRGDPGASQTFGKSETYLTREYQLCFKCHSNYAYDATPPALGNAGTPASANSYNAGNAAALYTNQAGEFAAYAKEYTGSLASLTGTHQCEAGGDSTCTPIGASWDVSGNASTVNHRSWHPVMYPTGRTGQERGDTGTNTNTNFRAPFTKLGIQTMHCSDCHGHDATWTQGTGPDLSKVQGPHGSSNNFLLRGAWNPSTNYPGSPGFCGNCHNPGGSDLNHSGWGGGTTMGHSGSTQHNNSSTSVCGRCHVALPHGWKNKAFLVNLNCVGAEGGASIACSNTVVGSTSRLTRGPYYVGAALRVQTWNISRQWQEMSCGDRGGDASNKQAGKDWMRSTC